jgi:chromate transport protein ChrA
MALSLDIFWIFFKISLMAVGGGINAVLPQLEQIIVISRGWISHDQFMQSYVIAQFVPGPNIAMCPLIGYWVNGWPGFIAGFLGIYSGPILLIALVSLIYSRYRGLVWVRRSEIALRPLSLGLLSASLLRFWWIQTDPGHHTIIFRISAALFTIVGLALYFRKRITSIHLIFLMGGVWWITSWVVQFV